MPTGSDGYIITGSRYGAYENLPWMEPLRAFLRSTRDRPLPVFGICFGHQIMAQAYGAKVSKSETGWAIGSQAYSYTEQAGRADGPSFVFHQDQVEDLPHGARLIGSSRQCVIGALAYDFPALSVQYHPEFVRGYIDLLIDQKEGEYPAAVIAQARETLETLPVDNAETAQWGGGILQEAQGVRLPEHTPFYANVCFFNRR